LLSILYYYLAVYTVLACYDVMHIIVNVLHTYHDTRRLHIIMMMMVGTVAFSSLRVSCCRARRDLKVTIKIKLQIAIAWRKPTDKLKLKDKKNHLSVTILTSESVTKILL
jgi:hypothetical protein